MNRILAFTSILILVAGHVVSASAATRVSLKSDGGTYLVPVQINGAITLDFIIDSGAADVSVPSDVVLTLIRTGTLRSADFTGKQTYVMADGSKVPSATFIIRSLKVGDQILQNVKGSVASVNGDLLLGQSFLQRFQSWSMDNTNHQLVLNADQPEVVGAQPQIVPTISSPSAEPIKPQPSSAGVTGPACFAPPVPTVVDGATAARNQLVANIAAVKEYIARSDLYQQCMANYIIAEKAAALKIQAPLDPAIVESAGAQVTANQSSKVSNRFQFRPPFRVQ